MLAGTFEDDDVPAFPFGGICFLFPLEGVAFSSNLKRLIRRQKTG